MSSPKEGAITPNQTNQPEKISKFENTLGIALEWARAGRPVFPIFPIDPTTLKCGCGDPQCTAKHPILRGGHKDASCDPVKIKQLWKRANFRLRKIEEQKNLPISDLQPAIGGGTQGLIVLDIDSLEGFDLWKTLQDKYGPAPRTLTTASGRVLADTGGHGAHIAFLIPPDLEEEKLNRLTIWGGGHLDGRANGKGWVVLPPSLHRSGHRYIITDDSPIAIAPDWVVDFSLHCIAEGVGAKGKKTPSPAAPSSPPAVWTHIPLPPRDSWLFEAGLGVWWRDMTPIDRQLMHEALRAADPDSARGLSRRPSVDRLTWLSIIWSLRAHERLFRDGEAQELAMSWSRQFASHTDDSFWRTVWDREPDATQPNVGMQRLYDLADQNTPGWRDSLNDLRIDAAAREYYSKRVSGAVCGAPSDALTASQEADTGASAPSGGSSERSPRPASGPNPDFAAPPPPPPPSEPPAAPPGEPRPEPRAYRLSKSDPAKTADFFIKDLHPTLMRMDDVWLAWSDGAYRQVEDAKIKSMVQSMLERSFVTREDPATGERLNDPFKPKAKDVSEVVEAIKNKLHRDAIDRPTWINGAEGPQPEHLIAFPNCLLDWKTGETYYPNSSFFTRNAREFAYDPHAGAPEKWLRFLRQVFAGPQCEETIGLIQRMFGYLVSGDNRLQKIFMVLGPTRSGKSTMLQVIGDLIGKQSTASSTFSKIAKEFGQQAVIGSSVLMFPDAHMGAKTDREGVVEILKQMSGGDLMDIPRKFLPNWRGRLDARIVISANGLPDLADVSTALATRIVAVETTVSYKDREDHELYERDILPELPAIMNWALEGRAALDKDGRFVLTEGAKEMRDAMAVATNPVASYIEEHLSFGPEKTVSKAQLYQHYREWCMRNGEKELSSNRLARMLRMAAGGALKGVGNSNTKIKCGNKWENGYIGVGFRIDPENQRGPNENTS